MAEKEAAAVAPQDTEAQEEEFFTEPPEFKVDYKGDCAYEVGVKIPAANLQRHADTMLDEFRSESELPGFRKGRAPRKLIERKFGKALKGEVEARAVSAAFDKLVKDEKLRPLGMPDIDGLEEDQERSLEEPLEFTFKFEVAPRVELGKYRGVEVEKPILKIEDKQVDEAIDRLRERHCVFDTLEGGIAAEGDQVVIDFEGKVDGEAFAGGSAQGYPYILGTQRFFPEFEEVLKGASPGDELSCPVTFPEDYRQETLQGKTADFTIHVKEVKRRQLPELTDEFAKQSGFENVQDMREKTAERMRNAATQECTQVAEGNALESVVNDSTFEIPQTLLDHTTEREFQERVQRMLSQRVPMSEIEAHRDELRENIRKAVEREIKRMVVLGEIGEAEGIAVTEEDFEAEMEEISLRVGVDIDIVGAYMAADEERRSDYEERIYRAKALKVIMDNAKITEKEVTAEELEEQQSAESEEA